MRVDDLLFRRVAVLVGCEESYVVLMLSAVSGFFCMFFGSEGGTCGESLLHYVCTKSREI